MGIADGSPVVIVAAEAREFAGLERRVQVTRSAHASIQYVGETKLCGDRCLLLANGPGPGLVRAALSKYDGAGVLMSVGFCGALDPALRVGDIVVSGDVPRRAAVPFIASEILSVDRVAVTAEDKRRLRVATGAAVVEMELAAVAEQARQWGIPYRAVKVVSDTADQSLPLDFNEYRDRDGRFQLLRIAGSALARPFTVLPELLRLDRQCRHAADQLGAFLADCEY